jgi:hypothetical protein
MADIRPTPKSKLFVAMLIAPDGMDKLSQIDNALVEQFGEIDLVSPNYSFEFTEYYTPEMGPDLTRRIVSFEKLFDPADLAKAKLITNDLELKFRDILRNSSAGRIVNLDAGYLTLGQIILATTKSYSHRIFLQRGIWAEVTLYFYKGRYEKWQWTYPDYADGRYNDFWLSMREKLKG